MFKYLDKVKVTGGFFEGYTGVVTDLTVGDYLVRLDVDDVKFTHISPEYLQPVKGDENE